MAGGKCGPTERFPAFNVSSMSLSASTGFNGPRAASLINERTRATISRESDASGSKVARSINRVRFRIGTPSSGT
jgi:hypothetical protein